MGFSFELRDALRGIRKSLLYSIPRGAADYVMAIENGIEL
jgi:hypothetical protein